MLRIVEQNYKISLCAELNLAVLSPIIIDPVIKILRARPESIESADDGPFSEFLGVVCKIRVGDLNRGNFLQLVNQKRLGFGRFR